jgi:PAS domain S-box-containing protein
MKRGVHEKSNEGPAIVAEFSLVTNGMKTFRREPASDHHHETGPFKSRSDGPRVTDNRFGGGPTIGDMAISAVQQQRVEALLPFLLFALAAGGLYASSLFSYLLFHTLVEIACVLVLLSVFSLSWNSRRLLDNHAFLFLAISFLSLGTLQLFHTLAYKGFGIFPGDDGNLATQLWIASRYVFSLSFLAAPIFITRKLNVAATFLAFGIVTALLFAAIFSGIFPDCFIEGHGLTPFKVVSEYVIIAILLAAIGLLLKQRTHFNPRILRILIGSLVSAIAADTAFTQYLSVYGPANLIGHLFLLLSAVLIYKAIVETGIKEPAALLFHNLELSKQALKNSEERLRFALETCHIGAWDFDPDDHTVNRSLEHDRIFGYQELLPQWTLEMFLQHALPEHHAEVKTMLREVTIVPNSRLTHECRIRRADGEIRWIWFSGQHRTDNSGRSRVAGIVQDITERKLAEEQIRETAAELQAANIELRREATERKQAEEQIRAMNNGLERMVEQRTRELQETEQQYLHAEKLSAIGTLSASIAHEFNNPLQGIMSILKGLEKRAILEGEDRELLVAAVDECDRMKQLIRSLQEFYRPSSNRKEMMDLQKSIDSLLLLHKSDFNSKRISVKRNYADHLPQILAIPDQIKQVLLNLLTNAADACLQPGGVITISTWQEDRSVVVAIKDTGAGIKPENLDLIFQPFYTTKPEVRGTGLGLSICHDIVQKHRGEIRVESRPGEGSTFTVVLPVN